MTSEGGIVSRLYNEHIRNTQIAVPSLAEQSAIARFLSDMDDEIEQLEKEQQKYIALKQGAMQQLLTGQIRIDVKNHKGTQRISQRNTK